jgi:hypothetical protein
MKRRKRGSSAAYSRVHLADRESPLFDEVGNTAYEMATRKDAPMDRLHTLLPAPHIGVGGFTMLTEQQLPVWLEDTCHALECRHNLGDRAQGEGGEHRIDAVVCKRNPLPWQIQKLDGKRPSHSLAPGKLEHAGGGL